MDEITLGIVIPVFHSTVSVLRLTEDIRRVLDPVCSWHVWLVDDGNPPETADWLVSHLKGLPHVTLIRLKRNYGQQNALLCGIRHSLGCRYIVTMDDDLQHDAGMLPTLYDTVREGYDIVYAVPRGERGEGPVTLQALIRGLGSRMRDRLFRRMLHVPAHIKVGSFRIMTRDLAREVCAQASGFFYLSAAVFVRPRKAKTCCYEARLRVYGESGYTLWKLAKLYGSLIRFYSPAAPFFTSRKRRQAMLYEERTEEGQAAPVMMILGGSNCQLNALRRARSEGYRVVLADYTDHPPGADWAHVHCKVSTFDIDGCTEAAGREGVEAVMTIGTDQPVYTAACVSERLGLPSFLKPEEALAVTNKKVMKQILTAHGLPTAPYVLVDAASREEDLRALAPPLVIKPLDSQGQRGIFRCPSASETLSRLSETLSFSRCRQALAEQFYDSDEITVSGWVSDRNLRVLTVTDRLLYPDPVHIGICIGHRFPSVHMDRYEEIAALSQEVASAFGLREGPFYLQLLIGREGIRVNELACRIGGAFEDVVIPYLTGFDILKAVMDLSLGRKVTVNLPADFRPDRVRRCACVQLLFGRPGLIADCTPLEEVRRLPFLLDCGYNYLPGQRIPAAYNATARLGHGVITGEPDTIAAHIDRFYETLKVLSPAGENLVMRLYPRL
ncbi:MAG: glycosyltransferase [Hungatella sp.]|nr:glycosyltransferase [Hungatella sp.]